MRRIVVLAALLARKPAPARAPAPPSRPPPRRPSSPLQRRRGPGAASPRPTSTATASPPTAALNSTSPTAAAAHSPGPARHRRPARPREPDLHRTYFSTFTPSTAYWSSVPAVHGGSALQPTSVSVGAV